MVATWSDEDVAWRWLALCPLSKDADRSALVRNAAQEMIVRVH